MNVTSCDREEDTMSVAQIVFMQGEEGRTVVDRLTRTEGVVVHGATDATVAEAIAHLRQWETGDEPVTDSTMYGVHDEVVMRDGYVLSWNTGLGYVGLARMADTQVVSVP